MKKLTVIIMLLLIFVGCTNTDNKANMSDYKGMNGKENNYVSFDYDEVLSKIENKDQGLYFFGFSECPWCKEFVPVFQEALSATQAKAFYINVRSEKWGDSQVDRFERFNNTLPDELRGDGVPYLIAIDGSGNVKTHVGTLPSHNAKERIMTADESSYLLRILKELINTTQNSN